MLKVKELIERIKNSKYFYPIVLVVSLFLGTFLIIFTIATMLPQKKDEGKKDQKIVEIPNPTIKPLITISPTTVQNKNPLLLQGTTIFYPTLFENYIYYLSDAGTRFYKISLDGKEKTPYSDVLIASIKNVIWSKDKALAVLQVENNKYFLGKNNSPFLSNKDENMALTNWLYNFETKQLQQIETYATAFSFSPSGKLYYIKPDVPPDSPPQYFLYSFGAPPTRILAFPEGQDALFQVSETQIISSVIPEPSPIGVSYYLIDLTTKEVVKISPPPNTFNLLTSSSGNYGAAQTIERGEDTRLKLRFLDVAKKTFLDLVIDGDLEKLSWSKTEDSLFIVKNNQITKISFPDFKTQTYNFPKEISLSTIDNDSLMVGGNNTSFFFTYNNSLYSVSF